MKIVIIKNKQMKIKINIIKLNKILIRRVKNQIKILASNKKFKHLMRKKKSKKKKKF